MRPLGAATPAFLILFLIVFLIVFLFLILPVARRGGG
jgi:hypothetical protein